MGIRIMAKILIIKYDNIYKIYKKYNMENIIEIKDKINIKSHIYLIENKINNKVYIGQAVPLDIKYKKLLNILKISYQNSKICNDIPKG